MVSIFDADLVKNGEAYTFTCYPVKSQKILIAVTALLYCTILFPRKSPCEILLILFI